MVDLSRLFNPQAIAVIGASRNPNKVGSAIVKNLRLSFRGQIIPINPFTNEIQGLKAYKSVLNYKDKIDIAVISIPANKVLKSLKECEKKRIPFAIIISAGFKEIGKEGQKREDEIKAFLKHAKIRVIGPNCLGIINTSPLFNATFIDPNAKILAGKTALISQSGALLSAIVDDAVTNNIGFSKVISIGNATDLDEADMIDALSEDENTKAIAIYLEGLTNGKKFIEAASRAIKKKPIILLKGGRSEASSEAVSSHTGSLAGNYKAYELAFSKIGAIIVDNIDDLFNFMRDAQDLRINSDEVVIVTNAGGGGVITSDHIHEKGLKLAEIDEKTKEELSKILPLEANIKNPIDMVGDASPDRYKDTLNLLVKLGKPMIVIFSPQEMSMPIETAEVIYDIHTQNPGVPILPVFLGGARVEKARKFFLEKGMPSYDYPNEAVDIIKGLYNYSKKASLTFNTYKKVKVPSIKISSGENLFGIKAKQIFDRLGIFTTNGVGFKQESEIRKAVEKVGFPCVLKISSKEVAHKNKIEGVITGIKNENELREAITRMNTSMKANEIKDFSYEIYEDVSKYGRDYVELLIGAHRDPVFGPMIGIGLGGIYADEIELTQFALSPISDQEIEEIKASKIGKILSLAAKEPVEEKTIDYLIMLDKLMNKNPEIKDIDLNPVFLFRDRAIAGDFKIFLR